MNDVTLTIDGRTVTVPAGTSVLFAALDNGIYVPNLCALREDGSPEASCRLCWVNIDGETVLSCTRIVEEGMVVDTRTEAARALARRAYELLMASHDTDCAHCPATGHCELQKMAARLRVPIKPKDLRLFLKGLPPDDSNPLFTYIPDRCVLCGRCVRTCRRLGKTAVLGFAHRGFDRRLTTFGDGPIGEQCLDCTACVQVCPTGALVLKKQRK